MPRIQSLADWTAQPLCRLSRGSASTARREAARRFRERLAAVEKWVEIAPFDHKAQRELLCRLAERGRIDAGKRHLTAAERLYRAEALDFAPIRKGWRNL